VAAHTRMLAFVLSLLPIVSEAQTVSIFTPQPGGGYSESGSPAAPIPPFGEQPIEIVASASSNSISVQFRYFRPFQIYRTIYFSTGAKELAPGNYEAAVTGPDSGPFSGFYLEFMGPPCASLPGRFVVYEFERVGTTVVKFAADFERQCFGHDRPTVGSVRVRSSLNSLPFGGDFPRFQLTLTPPVNGTITGAGLECDAAGMDCTHVASAAEVHTLTAVPAAGYQFGGWTGDCLGAEIASLNVNGTKTCGAQFVPVTPSVPRMLMVVEYLPAPGSGDPLRRGVYSLANSFWRYVVLPSGLFVEVQFLEGGLRKLPIAFRLPPAPAFPPGGTHAIPPGRYGGERLDIADPFCQQPGGYFYIHELVYGAGSTIQRFAIDFVRECPTGVTVYGSIRYASVVPQPTISLDKPSLRFGATTNGATLVGQTPAQHVRLTEHGPGVVAWSAVASEPWLTVTPASGVGGASLEIAIVSASSLPPLGETRGTVTIQLAGAATGQRTIDVDLRTTPAGTTGPPIGTIDTPLQNLAGVTGAIPISGWALDDVGVADLTICRHLLPIEAGLGNCGPNQVFIGTATFIDGARPDVQTAFPLLPRNARGGWGFMLLTNMLPGQGNGTFTFSAFARDVDGHHVLLGERTITCANAQAVRPFGTIDTPSQGGTASGSAFANFGWALTPQGKTIPFDGSTISVLIDGAPIGTATYNNFRPDVAALFPGYSNSHGAVGYRLLDTTVLTEGLHSISWVVTDDAGVSEGIGSRFFTVANSNALVVTGTSAAAAPPMRSAEAASRTDAPLRARRGFDLNAPWTTYTPDSTGLVVIHGQQLDRFELALGDTAGGRHAGYMRVGDALRELPAGSRLDPQRGSFTWAPAVGFIGPYDLEFVRLEGGQISARRGVRIVLHPQGQLLDGLRVVIDTPRSQQDVAQPFAVSGWAADLEAAGTGVTTLHVWAFPLAGGPPIFAGAAPYGLPRDDVARAYGDRFRPTGFGVRVDGLPHGNYDLAIFAWSTTARGFAAPRFVRVTVR
jgi:hypothetical protein